MAFPIWTKGDNAVQTILSGESFHFSLQDLSGSVKLANFTGSKTVASSTSKSVLGCTFIFSV